MSDSDLRRQVIRLAYANPELQPHLLPILVEASREDFFAQAKKQGWQTLSDNAVKQAVQAFHISGSDPKLVSKKIDGKTVVLHEQGSITAYLKAKGDVVSKRFLAFPQDAVLKEIIPK